MNSGSENIRIKDAKFINMALFDVVHEVLDQSHLDIDWISIYGVLAIACKHPLKNRTNCTRRTRDIRLGHRLIG